MFGLVKQSSFDSVMDQLWKAIDAKHDAVAKLNEQIAETHKLADERNRLRCKCDFLEAQLAKIKATTEECGK